MAINEELTRRPATRGDVSVVAIATSLSLDAIARSLEAIVGMTTPGSPRSETATHDILSEIQKIREHSKELEGQFDRLAGWTTER